MKNRKSKFKAIFGRASRTRKIFPANRLGLLTVIKSSEPSTYRFSARQQRRTRTGRWLAHLWYNTNWHHLTYIKVYITGSWCRFGSLLCKRIVVFFIYGVAYVKEIGFSLRNDSRNMLIFQKQRIRPIAEKLPQLFQKIFVQHQKHTT